MLFLASTPLFLATARADWTSLLNASPSEAVKANIQFPLESKWQIDPDGYWGFRSSPAVYKNTVYVGSMTGRFYAVDGVTGKEKWHANLPDRVEFSSPAVDDTGVYVGCEDGHLYAFGHDGKELWKIPTGAKIECSPIAVNSRVYVGNKEGLLVCVDSVQGRKVWEKKCDGPVFARPTVVGDAVYIGTEGFQGGTLYALNTENGKELFTPFKCGSIPGHEKAAGAIYSSVLHARGRLYFGSMDGSLYCLDAKSGTRVWTREFEKGISGSPAMAGKILVIGVQDRNWYGINATDGSILWKRSTDRYYPSLRSPVIVNSTVLVQYEYKLLALNLVDGEKVFDFQFTPEDGPADGPAVAVSGERLYICTRFKLVCFAAK